jgi:predicted dithiol-disulfide oxidoreductase (DUF899 family)
MSELRYPNENKAYREARAALLKDEQELIAKVKSVAEKRRQLPLGGQLKEDYVFQWASDGKVGKPVRFSELFGDKNSLLLYSWMFGPNWDKPCPSCTSLMDGFDRTWYSVAQNAAFAAVAKAPAERINVWAKERGWSQIPLVSGSQSTYQAEGLDRRLVIIEGTPPDQDAARSSCPAVRGDSRCRATRRRSRP